MNTDKLKKIINLENECDWLDFKSIQYKKNEDLLKDVMAFANSKHLGSKYIIIGVKDYPHGKKDVLGIPNDVIKDSSEIQNFILSNIEPDINLKYYPVDLYSKKIVILEIKDSQDKPYMLKKDYGKLKSGTCYIRKGSLQKEALRNDYDSFYRLKEKMTVEILDDAFFLPGNLDYANTRIIMKNHSLNPLTIMNGYLELFDQDGEILTSHWLGGFDRKVNGRDFTLHIPAKTEVFGEAWFRMLPVQIEKLNLEVDSVSIKSVSAKLVIIDSSDNEYITRTDNYSVIRNQNIITKNRKFKGKLKTLF